MKGRYAAHLLIMLIVAHFNMPIAWMYFWILMLLLFRKRVPTPRSTIAVSATRAVEPTELPNIKESVVADVLGACKGLGIKDADAIKLMQRTLAKYPNGTDQTTLLKNMLAMRVTK